MTRHPVATEEQNEAAIVSTVEAIDREWDELAVRCAAPPFLRPGWIDAWWRAFGTGALQIVTIRRAGRLVAVLPLSRRGRTLRGTANEHSPWFGPLADEPALGDELGAFVAGLRAATVRLDQLRSDDPVTRGLLDGLRHTGFRFLERGERSPFVPTDGSREAYQRSLSRGRRESIRRRLRKAQAVGAPLLEMASGPWTTEELDAALATGFAIEARGWKGRQGTAVSAREDTATFYRAVAAWAAEEGILRLVTTRAGATPLAFSMDLEADSRHYGLKLGIDPDQLAVGPGILHTHLLIERCFADRLASFEMLGWDEPWKRSFAPHYRARSHVVALAPGPVGHLRWVTGRSVRAARHRAGVVIGRTRGSDAQA